jgi:hypothetical protein
MAAAAAAQPVERQTVTVAQLEQNLTGAQRGDDRDVARRIAGMQLTERISRERLQRLSAVLPGVKSREALTVAADLSAFLDLPQGEVPQNSPPDRAAQKEMLSRAVDYVVATLHRLPDFLATRHLKRFEDLEVKRGIDAPVTVRAHGFRRKDRSDAKVVFREGVEVIGGDKELIRSGLGLTDHGIFGSLLGVVMVDVLKGRVGFDHWEPGPNGPMAVFRYVVGEAMSHYTLSYCCYRGSNGLMRNYHATPPYHGELAIDPETGAILRLLIKTDLNPGLLRNVEPNPDKPLQRADVVVEYGSVPIGGNRYVVPLQSVSVLTSLTLAPGELQRDRDGRFTPKKPDPLDLVEHWRVNSVNDYVFDEYHLFRGDMRIVPDVDPGKP